MNTLFLLLLALASFAMDKQPQLMKFDENQLNQLRAKTIKLQQSMVNCTPYEFDVGSPLLPEAKRLKSIVVGLESDKSCKFVQTLPHGEIKTCALSEAHRQQIKAEGQKALNRFLTDSSICKSTKPQASTETKPITKNLKLAFGSPDMSKKSMIAEKFQAKEAQILADYKLLQKMRDELNQRQVRVDCATTSECKHHIFGHKICGGPIGSFAYSTRDPKVSALIKEVDSFTKLDVEIQRTSTAASTCDVYEAPEPNCLKGICE